MIIAVSRFSVESDYNVAHTSGMAIAHFRMIYNELVNKDPDVVPVQVYLFMLDRKYRCVFVQEW